MNVSKHRRLSLAVMKRVAARGLLSPKGFSEAFYRTVCGAELQPVLRSNFWLVGLTNNEKEKDEMLVVANNGRRWRHKPTQRAIRLFCPPGRQKIRRRNFCAPRAYSSHCLRNF